MSTHVTDSGDANLGRHSSKLVAGLVIGVVILAAIAIVWSGHRDRKVRSEMLNSGLGEPSVTTALPYLIERWWPEVLEPLTNRIHGIEIYSEHGAELITNFSDLRYLEEVSIWGEGNEHSEPFDFSGCEVLQSVFITDTKGSASSFRNCSELTNLVLSGMGTFPSFPDLEGCDSLTSLSINATAVHVGDTDLAIPSLTEFSFYGAKIDRFPDLSGCSKLEAVFLSASTAVALPDLSFLGDKLQRLSVYGKLLDLPNLSGLTGLKKLELGYFLSVEEIPSMVHLMKLEDLTLDGMPLTELPTLPNELVCIHLRTTETCQN